MSGPDPSLRAGLEHLIRSLSDLAKQWLHDADEAGREANNAQEHSSPYASAQHTAALQRIRSCQFHAGQLMAVLDRPAVADLLRAQPPDLPDKATAIVEALGRWWLRVDDPQRGYHATSEAVSIVRKILTEDR